jgi:hypothetical protein
MTESERDLLMPFLRKLVQSRNTPGDEAANTLIHQALGRQPNATYLLVQRALTLEAELAAARRRICEFEGRPLDVEAVQVANPDFLNPATGGWGQGGAGSQAGESVARNGSATTSKKLYDFFKEVQTNRADDLESRAIIFIGKHSGMIWLGILAIVAIVVVIREKIL